MSRFMFLNALLWMYAATAQATDACANADQSAGACGNCCIATMNCGQFDVPDPTFQQIMALLACRRDTHDCQRDCLDGDGGPGGPGGPGGGAGGGDGGDGGDGGAGGDSEGGSGGDGDEDNLVDVIGTVRLQLFIPYEGLLLPDTSLVGSPPSCIKADNRSFNARSNRFRARADVMVSLPGDEDAAPSALITQMSFGPSAAYAWDDTIIRSHHEAFECKPRPGAVPEVVATLPISDDVFMVEPEVFADPDGDAVNIRYFISANIPSEVFPVSPAIDAELLLRIERLDPETGALAWILSGSHDFFPAYELYFGQAMLSASPSIRQLYGYTPAAEGRGPHWLAVSQDVLASGQFTAQAR